MKKLLLACIPAIVVGLVMNCSIERGYSDLVLWENWADETAGNAPNTTPDVGNSVWYGGGNG